MRHYAAVHFAVLNADVTDSLLHLMQGVYAPAVLQNRTWPESIRKEFTGQLHKFMAGPGRLSVHHFLSSTGSRRVPCNKSVRI